MRRHPGRSRTRLHPLHLLLLAVLLVPIPSALSAQQLEQGPRFWLGVGAGGIKDQDDLRRSMGMRQAVFQTGAHHLALRQAGELYYTVTNPSISEISVVYGRTALTPSGHALVGTGISSVALCQSEPGGGPERCDRGWGVPLVAEMALSWWSVGVGVQGFANVNQTQSYTGAVIFLQMGKIGS